MGWEMRMKIENAERRGDALPKRWQTVYLEVGTFPLLSAFSILFLSLFIHWVCS